MHTILSTYDIQKQKNNRKDSNVISIFMQAYLNTEVGLVEIYR